MAPTLLELSGTPVPTKMTGRSITPLLRSEKSGRLDPAGRPDIVFGRERHVPAQEAPEMGGYLSAATLLIDFINAETDPPGVSAKPNVMVLFNPGFGASHKADGAEAK